MTLSLVYSYILTNTKQYTQLLKNNLCQGFGNDISQLLLKMTLQQCHNSILSQIMKEMENNINMFALTVYDKKKIRV